MYQMTASGLSNFACIFEVFKAHCACSLAKKIQILIFILNSVCQSVLEDGFFPSDKFEQPRFREAIFIGYGSGIGSPQFLINDIVGGAPAIINNFGRCERQFF